MPRCTPPLYCCGACPQCAPLLARVEGRILAPPPVPRRTPQQSEKALQGRVMGYAARFGWLAYHTHTSRCSPAGFPDVVALRRPRLVVAELKSSGAAYPTRPQQAWLEHFWLATAAEVYVWSVEDEADIVTLLAREEAPVRSATWMTRCKFPFPLDWPGE